MSDNSDGGLTEEDVAAAREEVIEALARSAEAYGSKRSYGRLFGILYFADGPLSLDELVDESGYAKSTVSTAMNTLERFHLVQRRSIQGEGKRAFFEAEEDFWYVFQQFLDQQIRQEVERTSHALEAAEIVLSEGEGERARADLAKIRELGETYERSETLIDAVTSEYVDGVASLTEQLREGED